MEISEDGIKETEFNSNIATLRRIDELMRQLHDLSRGIMPMTKFGMPLVTGNPYELYLTTVERLIIEGQVKFDDDENEDIKKIKEEIEKIKNKYGNNLHIKKITKGIPSREYANPLYYSGWDELNKATRKLEERLVFGLDKHGMLMVNKGKEEFALR